jgi:uncharacterized RDD family membrane protein YckC
MIDGFIPGEKAALSDRSTFGLACGTRTRLYAAGIAILEVLAPALLNADFDVVLPAFMTFAAALREFGFAVRRNRGPTLTIKPKTPIAGA